MKTIQVAVSRVEQYTTEVSRTGTRSNGRGGIESYSYTVQVQRERVVTELVEKQIPQPVAERAADIALEQQRARRGAELGEAALAETVEVVASTLADDPSLLTADDPTLEAALAATWARRGGDRFELAAPAATSAAWAASLAEDGAPVVGAGGSAGGDGNPYVPNDEFSYALHETWDTFGSDAALELEGVRARSTRGRPRASTPRSRARGMSWCGARARAARISRPGARGTWDTWPSSRTSGRRMTAPSSFACRR